MEPTAESTVPARPRLLYFADTMCSWCYGFAPEMQLVLSAVGDRAEMLLFTGGLRPFTKTPVAEEMRGFFSETYGRIGELSGQIFAHPASLTPGFVYDTEPASRAVVTMRHIAPGEEYPFMLAIQRAFYADGEDITRDEVLAAHAEAAGVPRADFLTAFGSNAMRQATLVDFQVAQQFDVDGFPTLIFNWHDASGKPQFALIGKGYAKAPILIERLNAALAGT